MLPLDYHTGLNLSHSIKIFTLYPTGLNIPTVLVTGEKDYLADPTDELWLLQQIKKTVIKFMYLDNYNHLDFLWSMDAPTRIYYPVIEIMKSML